MLVGTWRLFNLNVTSSVKPGQANSLAVEIFPPQPRDLAITLVDWAPMPPDKEMGIWRDVHITATGPIALRYPAVLTKLDLPSADRATLTIRAELTNAADHPVELSVKGHIENLCLRADSAPRPERNSGGPLHAREFPQLIIANPRLWWPAQVGRQDLYPLDLTVEVQGQVSDSAHIRFGVRQVTSKIDEKGHRIFQINGKNILIRGAGYSFDMLLRSSPERQQAELNYVRDLNLNTVRLEGKLENEHFFDLADQMGILVMPGWCCCDQWENWPAWDKENETIAARFSARPDSAAGAPSLRNQLDVRQRLRASARDRENVLGNPAGDGLAEPLHLFGGRPDYHRRIQRREDDGTLRVRRALILVSRHTPRGRVRFQHRDQSGSGDPAHGEPAAHAASGPPLAD